ncbi:MULTISPECIES: hypothetical protein [unclassified Mesorhizobium]|uniref:hypothetical protein n=1 Tax=unclassified Mesorhizobium TaxID=325217 RepID=UPI001FE1827E|nr:MULTISPECIES: hypothetical protein [unclassified Mesorhizobium]
MREAGSRFDRSLSSGLIAQQGQNGETIRIGFSNEVPWAYPGENNEPLGLVNAMLDILKKIGTM